MSAAATIAQALRGKPYGPGWLCRCPVPTHGKGKGDRQPSLSIKDGDTALLVCCFAGCDSRDILDELRRRGLIEEYAERSRRARRSSPGSSYPSPPEPEPDPRALRLWLGACPIAGTLAETYLTRERGLSGPFPQSLRCMRATYARTATELPALAAALTRPDRKIVAVQLTFLTENGAKASVAVPRQTIGAMGTGAIRLAPCTNILGLAEGVEKAIAAMQLTGVPTWASAGASRLHCVAVPDTVREIHIFADNDDTGREAAERTAERHIREGRRVLLRFPRSDCKDWDDFLRALGRRAA